MRLPHTDAGRAVSSIPLMRVALAVALLLLSGLAIVLSGHSARADGPHVAHIVLDGDINAGSARFVSDAIDQANREGASLLVITLDTPGGDLDSMKAITVKELASHVPIAVYVSPSGARAGSAGTFVTLAAPIAAMAPATRIGAASPVDASGGDLPSTLDRKIRNDLLAFVRQVQTSYGRNVTLAENTVIDAASFDDQEAVSQHLVDLRATDMSDLLTQVEGRSVTYVDGSTHTVHSAGLPIVDIQQSIADQLQGWLTDPTVLFVLFLVAAVCIYLEFAHPGAILPGTVGAIALLLFLFAAGSLAPNWAGFGLMLLAIVLLAVDLFVPTHGILTVGAIISLVVGALIFFDTGGNPGTRPLNPWLLVGAAVGMAIIAVVVLRYIIGSQMRRITTGLDGFKGHLAEVVDALHPEGRVRVQGELWAARLSDATGHAEPGDEVRVRGVEGLKLLVEAAPKAAKK
jgi:membrane-bound serine protease (ClpP class)